MSGGIFVAQGDGELVKLEQTPYPAEADLQQLLERYPELLGGEQIDPVNPCRFVLVEREAGVPSVEDGASIWSLDHLFLDQRAIPTFVEVKRASDTRSRREVVAQMLDYAANATEYWPVERMRATFEARCAERAEEPERVIADLLQDAEADSEAFWAAAKRNLREGRVRLLFVADQIPQPLRRIVEFLNRQMDPAEVLAVEVTQFVGTHAAGELRTLVPRVMGQLADKSAVSGVGRVAAIPSSEQMFLNQMELERREIAQMITRSARGAGFVPTWASGTGGKVRCLFSYPGVKGATISLYSDASLWVSLGRYHPQLRNQEVNQGLREALLMLAPTNRSVLDPQKSEIGLRYEVLATCPDQSAIGRVFNLMSECLSGPT